MRHFAVVAAAHRRYSTGCGLPRRRRGFDQEIPAQSTHNDQCYRHDRWRIDPGDRLAGQRREMDHTHPNENLDRLPLPGHFRLKYRLSALHICAAQLVGFRDILWIRAGAARYHCYRFYHSW